MPMPVSGVIAQAGHGTGRMSMTDASVLDHGDFVHSVFGGPPDPIRATTSFRVEWLGGGDEFSVVNGADGHSGVFVLGSARMEWTATAGPYQFVSDPIEASSSSFAVLGTERNGMFHWRGQTPRPRLF
ncbi:hypothetical protein AYO38_07035 [bacterium SCGC AG-212-C10]|nr:hypothetical protein AYO38_07035 [bacterium SCGC AG-212-C10]